MIGTVPTVEDSIVETNKGNKFNICLFDSASLI
jgi:hypothetical protein